MEAMKAMKAMDATKAKEAMEAMGQKEKQLWGRRKTGEEPPLTEVHCKKVKIAKQHPEAMDASQEAGKGELQILHQNGEEEAKDTILYMLDQMMNKNSKGGGEAVATAESRQAKILAMRERGKEVRQEEWVKKLSIEV